jgi:hypothetical protein
MVITSEISCCFLSTWRARLCSFRAHRIALTNGHFMVDGNTDSHATSDGAGYIRGGGGVVVDRGLVVRVVAWAVLLVLLVVAVLLTRAAVNKNSRIDGLKSHGVAVQVTVTECLGMASGTGITVTGFKCRGTFELTGRRYEEVIEASSIPHQSGDVVAAIVDPRDPTSLTLASVVSGQHASWTAFVIPAIPALLFVAGLATLLMSMRSRRVF